MTGVSWCCLLTPSSFLSRPLPYGLPQVGNAMHQRAVGQTDSKREGPQTDQVGRGARMRATSAAHPKAVPKTPHSDRSLGMVQEWQSLPEIRDGTPT